MNLDKLTLKAQEAVQTAVDLASSGNHQAVSPSHLLLALVTDSDNVVNTILNKVGVRIPQLKSELEKRIENLPVVKGASVSGQYLSNDSKEVFDNAQASADKLGDEYISSEHVLIGMLDSNSEPGRILKEHGVKKDDVLTILQDVRGSQKVDDPNAESRYNALKKYGRDLNEQAEKNKLDPVIGRDQEIRRIMQILSRRTKNNPVLIGEAGVGKTAIAE
jgi:ATP-dependent Clp protease ATP-binding subunit ClpB